jgi:hypothetical protein
MGPAAQAAFFRAKNERDSRRVSRRLTFTVCASLQAQEPPSALISGNSIGALLAEKAPQLQEGYVSADDVWMLYDWRFDLLSTGAQEFLLKKYGYVDSVVDGLDSEGRGMRRSLMGRETVQAVAGPPAPGANMAG